MNSITEVILRKANDLCEQCEEIPGTHYCNEVWVCDECDSVVVTAREQNEMGKYSKGDHVKIEVVNEHTGESEWMWLLVERSDDHNRLVFGKLDSQPVVVTDMHLGQELAVSYDNIRAQRRFD